MIQLLLELCRAALENVGCQFLSRHRIKSGGRLFGITRSLYAQKRSRVYCELLERSA